MKSLSLSLCTCTVSLCITFLILRFAGVCADELHEDVEAAVKNGLSVSEVLKQSKAARCDIIEEEDSPSGQQ